MKIVLLDGYTENPGDLSWAQLEAFGDLTVYDRTPYEVSEIVRRIGDAEIVITNKTPIGREVLDACPQVRFIAVLATGYNVVDVQYAREKGIPVSNVPAYGTAAVGQFAIALLLEICSQVKHHSDAVHAGRWQSAPDWTFWDYPLIELAGKTMGIIGFGRIGQSESSFDGAHFLTDYYGKCENLHGHRWRVIVYLAQEELQQTGTMRDMVLDFGVFKSKVRLLCDEFDHTFLVEEGSLSPATVAALEGEGFTLTVLPFRTTAENLARWFYEKLAARGLPLDQILLWITVALALTALVIYGVEAFRTLRKKQP